jgi:DNA-binding GntR family transcriptional regulator
MATGRGASSDSNRPGKRGSGSPDHDEQDKSSLPLYIKGKIKSAIEDGKFEPGARLRVAEICDWLEVSRTPVREALSALIAEGFLIAQPSRGIVVNQLTRRQVMEFYAVRRSLEGLAARLAAQLISDDDIHYLEQLTQRSQALNDPVRQEQLNKTFHQTIHIAANNSYLTAALGMFESTIILLKGTTYSIPGRPEEAHAEHRALIEALKRRDAASAEELMQKHIRSSERSRLRMLFEAL